MEKATLEAKVARVNPNMLTLYRRAGVMGQLDAFFSPRFPLLYFAALIGTALAAHHREQACSFILQKHNLFTASLLFYV